MYVPLWLKMEIEERRERVAEMYLQRMSTRAIAAQLGVSQTTVCEDIAAIRLAWQEDAKRNFGERQAEELASLAAVETEAWAAWKKSKEPKEETYAETTNAPPAKPKKGEPIPPPPAARTKSSIRRSQTAGEDSFLAIIMECRKERAKIWGLYAPDKLQMSGGLASLPAAPNLEKLTDAELDEYERLLAKLEGADAGTSPGREVPA